MSEQATNRNEDSASSEMIRLSELCRKQSQEIVDLRGDLERAIYRANGMPLRLRKLINDDGFAASFQTMGQYRAALMREVSEMVKTPNAG